MNLELHLTSYIITNGLLKDTRNQSINIRLVFFVLFLVVMFDFAVAIVINLMDNNTNFSCAASIIQYDSNAK